MIRLGSRPAFVLLATLTVVFIAAAIAPTPLYPLYQARWGFSALMVTVVFGAYVLAVLASLLVFGRLSDHVGRRPVLLTAIGAQMLAMALFAGATGLSGLIVARVVQGLATGAAVAALGAALLDLHRTRGAVANAVTVPLGTAVGGLFAGCVVSFLPAPAQLVYVLFALQFLVLGAGVLLMPETSFRRPGGVASLRPKLSVSPEARRPLLHAAPAIVATWALPGFIGALGPSLMHGILDVHLPLASGLLLFAMAGSAGVAVLVGQRLDARRLTAAGAALLGTGLVLISIGLARQSLVLFFVGAMVGGLGFGSGFQGALRSVMSVAGPDERAGVLSVIYLIAYLAMGLPTLFAGYLIAHDGNLLVTAHEFAALIVSLAALAVVGALLRPRQAVTRPA